MSNITFIHHPNCYEQDPSIGHGDFTCRTASSGDAEAWADWPKQGAPVVQDAPQASPPPEASLAPPAQAPPAMGPAQAAGQALDAAADQITSAATWKAHVDQRPLLLPSGHTCLVRKRGGMDMFLQSGMVPNSLMPIIQRHMNDGRQVDMAKAAKDFTEDPEKLNDILEMANNVLLATVLDPKIFPVPKFSEQDAQRGIIPVGMGVGDVVPEALRDPDFLYADEVDMDDKMFIFQWATGGSADVERFRREQAAAMAAIPTVEGVGAEAVGDPED